MSDDNTTIDIPVFRIYMSHPIRGVKGAEATQEDIDKNIAWCKSIGRELQAWAIDWEKMDGFPPINIYVPADHDEFVQIAYKDGYITESQILAVDCEIVQKCQLVIMFGGTYSRGMQIEYDYAISHGIPVFDMPEINEFTVEALQLVIHLLLRGEGR